MTTNSTAPLPADGDGSLADDLVRGVKPIAEFLGESERRTSYLLERAYVPAGTVGSAWVASKKALRAHFARVTGAVD
jgi:hypothetical protein